MFVSLALILPAMCTADIQMLQDIHHFHISCASSLSFRDLVPPMLLIYATAVELSS